MKPAQAVCNYALLRFRPYAETEEFVNVGVLVMCQQPCLLEFEAERELPARAKALFPRENERTFAAALEALRMEMERARAGTHDPKSVKMAFDETVRIRESVFRFGEVRTILTGKPQQLVNELFARYVRMDATVGSQSELVSA
jgi:hypothetical protein